MQRMIAIKTILWLAVGSTGFAQTIDLGMINSSSPTQPSVVQRIAVQPVPDQPVSVAGAETFGRPLDQLRDTRAMVLSDSVLPSIDYDAGWWTPMVAQPIEQTLPTQPMTLDQTLIAALQHSHQIRVFSDLPLIRETSIIEAQSNFDWVRYFDTRWDDNNEPIGNALTAGAGVSRFLDQRWTGRGGVRRRTLGGGTFDVSQQLGYQDTNSQFFVPDPQGTARLLLGFTQPLMRGRGRVYNTSLICLAKIDKQVADLEFNRQLQSHLLEVARAYWALYLERAALLQRTNSYLRGKEVYDLLAARAELDASPSQINSAAAAIDSRRSELVRAQAAVRNAQSRLRSLVNAPYLADVEVLPADLPTFAPTDSDISQSVAIAYQNRPEVLQSVRQIKASSVRLNMSRNELLPILNLVTQTYVAGLAADGEAFRGFERQFTEGRPSYGLGLQYQLPAGNRAARARLQRRRLELRQINNQYATTLATVRHEVAVGVRELQTSMTELSTKQTAMRSRARQLQTMTDRWRRLPEDNPDAALTLENLLVAQNQLASAEFEYLTAQLTYNLSLINLKRVTGVLLQSEQIDITRSLENCLPTLTATKYDIGAVDR